MTNNKRHTIAYLYNVDTRKIVEVIRGYQDQIDSYVSQLHVLDDQGVTQSPAWGTNDGLIRTGLESETELRTAEECDTEDYS